MYLHRRSATAEENNLLAGDELVSNKIASCALDYDESGAALDGDKIREKEKGRHQRREKEHKTTHTSSTKDNKTETLRDTNKTEESAGYKGEDLLQPGRKNIVSERKKPLILGPKPFWSSSRGQPTVKPVASVFCYEERSRSDSRLQADKSKQKKFLSFQNNICQNTGALKDENFAAIKEACNKTLAKFTIDSNLEPYAEMENSSIASQVTQKLFKDIMEMKSLDNTNGCAKAISAQRGQQTLPSTNAESEEEWFKHIPLPPQAFSSQVDLTENRPNMQSCIKTQNRSSVTEKRVPRNQSGVTAASQQQQQPYLPPIPLKTKQKSTSDERSPKKVQLHSNKSGGASHALNGGSSKNGSFSLENNNNNRVLVKNTGQNPPKLPPKQHKLKRNSSGEYPKVTYNTEPNKREEQFLKSSLEQPEEKLKADKGKTVEKIHKEKNNALVKIESAEPKENGSLSNNNEVTTESQTLKSPNPEPISNDSFRSRSLVDEPLAPILEEDSVFDSSSSTISSLSRDFSQANENIIKEFIVNGEQDLCADEKFISKTPVENETSTPLQHTRVKKVSFDEKASDRVLSNKKVKQTEETKQRDKPDQSMAINTISSEKPKVENSLTENQKAPDVAPYGMVDLTKFEQVFKEEAPSFTEELTPRSILSSVHEFNTTLRRNKQAKTSSNSDESDLPSFPLQIKNSSPSEWNKTIRRNKTKKNHSVSTFHEDQVGYDNLEKYAANSPTSNGATIARSKSLKETSSDAPPSEISKVTASRLARHSSAVTTLDRHSNNMKRSNGAPRTPEEGKHRIQSSPSSSDVSTSYSDNREFEVKSASHVSRQCSVTSSLSDFSNENRKAQQVMKNVEDEHPYEEVDLDKMIKSEEVLENGSVASERSTRKHSHDDSVKRTGSSSSLSSSITSTNSAVSRSSHHKDRHQKSSDQNSKSLGTQLRKFLSGNSENKFMSPSLRRKRSLLKRSKSPGGSIKRSKTPPKEKTHRKVESPQNEQALQSKLLTKNNCENSPTDRNEDQSETVQHKDADEKPREFTRSASQRLVDRKGRSKSFRRSKSGDFEADGKSDKSKKRSSLSWMRSKSQDRPLSNSDDKKSLRSKSSERLQNDDKQNKKPSSEDRKEDNFERGRSNRGSFFRRSRSGSRKRDRAKSSERGGRDQSRGRNPVRFFRNLLKKRDSTDDEAESTEQENKTDVLSASEKNTTTETKKNSFSDCKKYQNNTKRSVTGADSSTNFFKSPNKGTTLKNQFDSFLLRNNSKSSRKLSIVRGYASENCLLTLNETLHQSRSKQWKSAPSIKCYAKSQIKPKTRSDLRNDNNSNNKKTLNTNEVPNKRSLEKALSEAQRKSYKTITSLNALTLRKITERRQAEWKNKLPVGGFLITSWSDIALTSHQPLCKIGKGVVYEAVSSGNNKFKLACQLYERSALDDDTELHLANVTSLPPHPNVGGVCSNFSCRLPRSLLSRSSRGGAADVVCVVLATRPSENVEENLEEFARQGRDPTEYHRKILLTVLQLINGMRHVMRNGFDLPPITSEQLVVSLEDQTPQILPHVARCDGAALKDSNSGHCQQLAQLIKRLLQKGAVVSRTAGARVVVPGTKYSAAIKHFIQYLQRSVTSLKALDQAASVAQCALWGPEDFSDVEVEGVTKLNALKMWLEVEQGKLVNSLAVLSHNETKSFGAVITMKHKFFSLATPVMIMDAMRILNRD